DFFSNILSSGLDPQRNRLPQLLHRRSSRTPRRAFARLLRLDLVSAANELCGNSGYFRCVRSSDTADNVADGSDRQLFRADRKTDMAGTEPRILSGDLVDAFKNYANSH